MSETLVSVKNLEESLKRLKSAKKNIYATDDGMSDNEKIRAQFLLDLEDFGNQVNLSPKSFQSPDFFS